MSFPNLDEIHDLMKLGHYAQALAVIEGLSPKARFEGEILRVEILLLQGELLEAKERGLALTEAKFENSIQELKALLCYGEVLHWLQEPYTCEAILSQAEEVYNRQVITPQALDQEFQSTLAFLRGFLHFAKGEGPQAIKAFEKAYQFQQHLENSFKRIHYTVGLAYSLREFSEQKERALNLVQAGLALAKSLDNPTLLMRGHFGVGLVAEDIEQSLSNYQAGLTLSKKLDHKWYQTVAYGNIGSQYLAKEDYEVALKYYLKHQELARLLNHRNWLAWGSWNIGHIHQVRGALDQALEAFQEAVRQFQEVGNELRSRGCLLDIGRIYSLRGDFVLALDTYNQVLSAGQKFRHKRFIAQALLHIAIVHTRRGELDHAVTNITDSLTIFTNLDDTNGIAQCYGLLGQIQGFLQKTDRAITHIEKAMDSFSPDQSGSELRPSEWRSYCLLQLIILISGKEDLSKAESLLLELQSIGKAHPNPLVRQRAQLAEALVLKMNRRGLKKFQAQQQFQAIVKEPMVDFHLTTLAMLNLCELLLLEMKVSEATEELLREISDISERLYDIGQDQRSPFLSVTAIILKAKLALIQGEFNNATRLLQSAEELLDGKKLDFLLLKVKEEQQRYQSDLVTWSELVQRKASFQERIEKAQVADYIQEAKKIQETWVQPFRGGEKQR